MAAAIFNVYHLNGSSFFESLLARKKVIYVWPAYFLSFASSSSSSSWSSSLFMPIKEICDPCFTFMLRSFIYLFFFWIGSIVLTSFHSLLFCSKKTQTGRQFASIFHLNQMQIFYLIFFAVFYDYGIIMFICKYIFYFFLHLSIPYIFFVVCVEESIFSFIPIELLYPNESKINAIYIY